MNHPPHLFLPYEILSDSRLTLRQIRVLMAIFSWRKSNTEVSVVSNKKASKITNYTEKDVVEIKSELIDLGWLDYEV